MKTTGIQAGWIPFIFLHRLHFLQTVVSFPLMQKLNRSMHLKAVMRAKTQSKEQEGKSVTEVGKLDLMMAKD